MAVHFDACIHKQIVHEIRLSAATFTLCFLAATIIDPDFWRFFRQKTQPSGIRFVGNSMKSATSIRHQTTWKTKLFTISPIISHLLHYLLVMLQRIPLVQLLPIWWHVLRELWELSRKPKKLSGVSQTW